jgi:DDE superfamily endonuclease/Helix-turn-helix of DDE superfamily endonuclease
MMMKHLYLSHYPSVFLKMTGLTLAEFEEMLREVKPLFVEAEEARLYRAERQRDIGGGRDADLSAGDQILLTVIGLRQYPTQDVLAYFFGVSQSAVSHYLGHVLPVLEQAGQDTMRLPDPGRKRRRSLERVLSDLPELVIIIDSFEQKVQRPEDAANRDELYSGKKKTHTLKSQVAVDEETGEIVDVPDSVAGPTADLKLLEQSGLPGRLPEKVGMIGDSGYQGIDKLHPRARSPRKKPRGKPRPPEDTAYNTLFSRRRIVVENSIGRMRRYQAITQPDRNHRHHHTARVRAVAGLVNRQIRSRLPA